MWSVTYYESPAGQIPVKEFIDSLEERAQTKIMRAFELLGEFGIRLGFPHVKKLTGTPLWELRIQGGDSIRIIYVAQEKQEFLVLHGFKKKTKKIELRELRTATERLYEYRARKTRIS